MERLSMTAETLQNITRCLFEKKSRVSLLRAFRTASFSQYGEDLFFVRMMPTKDDGFYVDVGAAHPIANYYTYRVYLKGWRESQSNPIQSSSPHTAVCGRATFFVIRGLALSQES
jgi:hypothetical protein